MHVTWHQSYSTYSNAIWYSHLSIQMKVDWLISKKTLSTKDLSCCQLAIWHCVVILTPPLRLSRIADEDLAFHQLHVVHLH